MDLDKLMQKYPNVSREELYKIRETSHYPAFSEVIFESRVSTLDRRREKEKVNGRESILVGPLVQVLSVHILPNEQNKPLTIFGRIFAEVRDTSYGKMIVHDFYNRKWDDPQVLGQNDTLKLISPDCSSWSFFNCMPLHDTKLVVDVYVGGRKLFAQFLCGEDMTDFEQVKLEYIHGDLGSLALRYIAMPFAVYGRVEVHFFHKEGYKSDQVHRFLNVKGKIVARSGNSFGGYASEEYTLFDKQSNEFEPVGFDLASMRLSRCWVGLPAYSSLIVDLDLSEFETERKILKETVELRVENGRMSRDKFIVDDILVSVSVAWFSPNPQGRCSKKYDESSDVEMSPQETCEEESDDDQMNEVCVPEASSKLTRPWQLLAHQNMPFPSSSVQIFSISIGREKLKALQMYGSVEVTSPECAFYVFNRDAKDAFRLSEHSKTMPILRGCGAYDDSESVKMKFNLKGLDSQVNIRGYVKWHWSSFSHSSSWLDKQLCSVVQGQHGFAAIHYTIFSEAVQANVEALCVPKNGRADFSSKVYGSLVAQYNNYDYTSRYNRDYYRIVLFQRNQEDPAQVGAGGVTALSRSMVAVPVNSSLIVEANISDEFSNQGLSCSTEFQIGSSNFMTMEGNDYSVHIYVKWEEVSN